MKWHVLLSYDNYFSVTVGRRPSAVLFVAVPFKMLITHTSINHSYFLGFGATTFGKMTLNRRGYILTSSKQLRLIAGEVRPNALVKKQADRRANRQAGR